MNILELFKKIIFIHLKYFYACSFKMLKKPSAYDPKNMPKFKPKLDPKF